MRNWPLSFPRASDTYEPRKPALALGWRLCLPLGEQCPHSSPEIENSPKAQCGGPRAQGLEDTMIPGSSSPLTLPSYFRIKDAHQKVLYTQNGQLLVGDPDSENCSAGEHQGASLLGPAQSPCYRPLILFLSHVFRDCCPHGNEKR